MSRKIEPDYESQYLFPRSLEEWVGPDDTARFIRQFVRELDLNAIKSEHDEAIENDAMGRPHYGFELLLSVWLYSYVYGMTSCREVERGCRTLLPLVWLAGTHQPDHNTLWRFWSRYRGELRKIFLQSVNVAIRAELVGMVVHAVDGTKIPSRGSRRSAWHQEDLKKLLALAEERVKRLEERIEGAERPDGPPDDRLPRQLQDQRALQEKIREALEELTQSGEKHLQPNDRESRMMVNGRGRTEFAYNAQAMVDDRGGIIVAAAVTDQANDEHQLAPMLEQVKHNIGEFAATTVADSGYDTAESLGKAEAMKADVLVAPKLSEREAHPYHASRFRYDQERDAVECPRGEWLHREGTRRHKAKPHALKTYRCSVTDCPVRSICSRDAKGRVIEISPHEAAIQKQREKRRQPTTRDLMKKRSATVERAFAEIKQHLGFRRWTVGSKAKVEAQWVFICTAMNLRRMISAGSNP